MKYLFIFLAFSLILFLPMEIELIVFKKKSDEYIKIQLDLFRLTKVFFEIPEMKFRFVSFIPVLSFEYSIKTQKNKASVGDKAVISPIKNLFKILITTIKNLYNKIKNLNRIVRFLFKLINISYIKVSIILSNENPAFLGLLAGQVWSVIYLSLSIFSYYFDFDKSILMDINVTPVFTRHEPIQVDIKGIFKLRVGHIIIASFIIIYWTVSKKKDFILSLYEITS